MRAQSSDVDFDSLCAGRSDFNTVFLTYVCTTIRRSVWRVPSVLPSFRYATHNGRDDKFCRYLRSAANFRVPVKILNWGGKHKGNGNKLVITVAELANLDPCDVVIFSDAFDVLYAQGAEHIVASVHKHVVHGGVPLLMSAECGCWPQIVYDHGRDICEGKIEGGYP